MILMETAAGYIRIGGMVCMRLFMKATNKCVKSNIEGTTLVVPSTG